MRSDREKVPGGFTKGQADKAETMEAAMIARNAQRRVTDGCQVYWPAPYEVCGAIRDKYNELGGPNSFLLLPTSNELSNPDGFGKRSTFQNGPIYWSSDSGAHPVVNHFFAAWQRNGWEAGVLKYPTSDEFVNPDGIGRRQYFQGGTIYWKLNEAYYVAGAIRDKWGETGWEGGFLGYPISDELGTSGGMGRFNRFEHGVIYWSGPSGAHPVSGGILDKWAATNYENGPYGFPVSDQRPRGKAVDQDFQGGTIGWPTTAVGNDDTDWQEDYIDDANCPGCGDDDRVRVNGPGYSDVPQPKLAPEQAPQRSQGAVLLDDLPSCGQPSHAGGGAPYMWCRPDDSARPRALPAWTSNLDKDYCKNLPSRQWAGDRSYQCMWRDGVIGIAEREHPERLLGTLSVVQENQLQTAWNSTGWKARTVLHVTEVTGEATAAKYAMSVWCSSDTSCKHDFNNSEDPRSVSERTYIRDYTINATVAAGAISRTTGFAEFTFTHPKATPVTTKTAVAPTVRCDAIGARASGCAVPKAEPILDMTTRNVPELAKHIGYGQASGLPGSPKGTSPLTRTTNPATAQNNRNISCNRVPRPRPAGMQCDEYPFATTAQGGGAGGPARTYNDSCDVKQEWVQVLDYRNIPTLASNGISMCLINASQNMRGGGITTWWFTKNRVLDGDTFYVKGA
ncbi:LGFP repeat-containing protein [Nocardia pseudobrasiliensis]|uniref:LGFP repeat-containing protein n=2 Tax=Nocardia pseudobrasiliensis TaxID=45979 RepID=A0A370HKK6_9NOCA|nr:LGFP repeat-containing protein [Nocardia pseudobrasiliensis]